MMSRYCPGRIMYRAGLISLPTPMIFLMELDSSTRECDPPVFVTQNKIFIEH